MKRACHDGSPFVDALCGCGEIFHLHLSQIENAPSGMLVGGRCPSCGEVCIVGSREAVRELILEAAPA